MSFISRSKKKGEPLLRIKDWKIYTPDRYDVFLEIETDEGLTGWGAAFSETGQVLGALAWLKRFVTSENPLEIERITEKLHQVTYWIGRGGAMTHAISAINIALWDLSGKILNQPVHTLLGGCNRRSIQAYASILFDPVETLADRIIKIKAQGFRFLKIGWEPIFRQSLAADERLIRCARDAAGDHITLLIDAGGSQPYWPIRVKDALERVKMLKDNDVYWLEEPLCPDDIEGYRRLTDTSAIKIAHGEVLTRRQSFLPYFRSRAMDIVQPDVAKVGGLSEMRRIAWLAEEHGIEIVPHGWNTIIGLAADLHLVSTLTGRSFVEFNVGNRLIDQLGEKSFQLDAEGCLALPDGPGFGIRVNRDRLREFEISTDSRELWMWDTSKEHEARV
jgi:D-galactarolactone cycloisomerase